MVTSYDMIENEMGYRGSKSELNKIDSVKEQRVDGSWSNYLKSNSFLRYTLMGFERNYQIKIPSKQLIIKNYSTLPSLNINPWFWTGLIDAEGSFTIIIKKSLTHKLGWSVETKFQMGLHKRDLSLLLQLQQYLGGVGQIYKYSSRDALNYVIGSNKELKILISHLEKYPLCTQKGADFILFNKVICLINNKSHLTLEGLNQIVNYKASINLGLSDLLKSEFIKNNFCKRPFIETKNIPLPNWVSGFVSGEGNFLIKISRQSTNF